MLSKLLKGSPRAVALRASLLIACIALSDWTIDHHVPFGVNVPLGFLYLFPMLLAGSALNRWQIVLAAALCTGLTEAFDTYEWIPESGIPRDILYFAAFFCMGLFVYEGVRSRRLAQQHLNRIEDEGRARREAEEQLKELIESSPAAIFTLDAGGLVLLANGAAHRLLGLDPGTLPGRSIAAYLPALGTVLAPGRNRQPFRTVMQCRGVRADGEVFLADAWFSTFRTSAGPRLAAMVVDTSEELRSREESSLHQLLAGSRILVGAVSHEVRNVCGAIAVVHANLARNGVLAMNKDFETLGTLIQALEKIAAMDLRQSNQQAASTDLQSVIDEVRIVAEPSLRDEGVEVQWAVEPHLPPVWADRHSLLHVFLNLIKNSARAMSSQPRRELRISAALEGDRVLVRMRDSGGGVTHPDRLFRPFQQGARETGLGLYLSRAFMRSFRGDLRYEPERGGSSFIVELSPFPLPGGEEAHGSGNRNPAARRPQPVS